jgi:hypothetical protein
VCQGVVSAVFYWPGRGEVHTKRMSLETVVMEDGEVTP